MLPPQKIDGTKFKSDQRPVTSKAQSVKLVNLYKTRGSMILI